MAIPLVDLHVHLRGTLSYALASSFALANSVDISGLEDYDSPHHKWKNFEEFLRAYDIAGSAIKSVKDLASLARAYLSVCYSHGVTYVEFMASPLHYVDNGLSYKDYLGALVDAFEKERNNSGIEARLIVTALRHDGAVQAERLAKLVSAQPSAVVVGFGLTGNEHEHSPNDFCEAFRIAKNEGLGLTAHTGEWLGPRSVIESVDVLKLDRIGHGVRLAEDERLLRDFAKKNVGIEVCLTSNAALRAVDDMSKHPVREFLATGCKLTIATDDPGFFATTPAREFELATKICGLSEEQSMKIYRDSVAMAFCDSRTKSDLISQLK